ncbi:type IV secretion system protein VirB10 [Brevundimonas sp. SORGH_AS_0993]|uniref:type IV secretion system protein VirB10 n=1 Tax=Brevundimonas sp. SORGH_AS_0993 TaxID=3041794 RepID=UPI00278B67B1|nr:type IV secretion system protein VirB10 [Brevundimonas sp. SORGH_AS_0993]MDQ1153068.1 type IV secretion system protein VirB10 [Brevundimonas sp. SORGH_AS_0993]
MTAPAPTPPGDTPPPSTAASDRGVSPIAGRFGGRQGKVITVAALAVGCGVFLIASWDRGDAEGREADHRDEPARQTTPFEPARRDAPPLLSEAASDPNAPTLTDGEVIPALDAAPGAENPPRSGPSPAEQRRVLAESARRAPVLAYSRAGGQPVPPPVPPTPTPTPPGEPTSLDRLRQLAPVGQTRAGRLPDRNLLVTAGTSVPCVLQTALDSTTPGYVTCVLPRDVWSDNGAVVLMERGTRVLGEYRGGLQQGRRRLFVLWTRAVTPTGVAVALASPAADALGRSGFDGVVDTHFWDRFGGALLLSIVDDGVYAAAGRTDGASAMARVPSDAASVALQGSVEVPPTLRKDQGSEVSIFVAQDLDFAGVYQLRPR